MSQPKHIPAKPLFALSAIIWLLAPATQSLFRGGPEALSPLVAPCTLGERIFSSAFVILEHMSWWLWPFGRDWVLRPLNPHGLFAINLLFWLIIVLMLRHAWRLRRYNPWVVGGLSWSILWLVPFSGLVPTGWQPFSERYLIVAGMGLAVMLASLILQCGALARRSRTPPGWKQLYTVVTLVLIAWIIGLVIEDGVRWSRSPYERVVYSARTNTGNAPAVAEQARMEAERGNLTKAEELVLQAERAAPWYREIPYIKIDILLQRGEVEAAQHYIRKILAEYPNEVRAKTKLARTLQ